MSPTLAEHRASAKIWNKQSPPDGGLWATRSAWRPAGRCAGVTVFE